MKEYFQTTAKFLKLDIPFPYEEMLDEARALRDRYIAHRDHDNEHKGWLSLTLYGLDDQKTESWEDYGYKSGGDAAKDFKWTQSAKDSPVTMNFLLNHFPSKQFGRVRFMLVEAGGYIGMHNDSRRPLAENINMPLNNPKECIWHWGDGEEFFMEPGSAYAMNIHYDHMIMNNSNEDRYHLIVARHDATPEWKALVDKAAAEACVTGEYIMLDALP
jgi:hypothetical protein